MEGNCILFETEGITKSERVLYTPGEFAKQNLFYVQEAGILTSLSAHKSAHKKLDSFLLLEVLHGSGIVVIEGNKYQLNVGDAVVIDCSKHYYHLSSDTNPWTIAWVHFNGHAAAGYYDMISAYCNDSPVLLNVFVRQLVEEILPLLRANNIKNELTVSEKLQYTLNHILRRIIENKNRESNVDWSHIREYINEKCTTDDFNIQNYVVGIENKFHITEEEISVGFKNHFGVDLRNYIEFRKLSIVKEKLRFTTKPINDIALEMGIKDNDTFVEIFRKNENMTPTEYRRNWAQWIRG